MENEVIQVRFLYLIRKKLFTFNRLLSNYSFFENFDKIFWNLFQINKKLLSLKYVIIFWHIL